MSYRKELEKKIERKLSEISDWEHSIDEARAFVEGLREALKMCPPDDGQPMPDTLRAGSDMDKVRTILKMANQPLHIDTIVSLMDKSYSDTMKVGLAGSLNSYAKKRKVFTRTAPRTFGLIEFEAQKPGIAAPDDALST
ncbi:MAG: hypothetical protein WBW41_16565 [Verrucomicrobiia bacterium]